MSREIVKTPAGNVTVFAFDEGQGLSEHTAPFDALVQVLEGVVEITIAGKCASSQRWRADSHARATASCAEGAAALQNDPYNDSVLTLYNDACHAGCWVRTSPS